jgi:hypothetical protein
MEEKQKFIYIAKKRLAFIYRKREALSSEKNHRLEKKYSAFSERSPLPCLAMRWVVGDGMVDNTSENRTRIVHKKNSIQQSADERKCGERTLG